jgi:hypothetical protein
VLAESVRSYFTGGWTTVIAYRLSASDGAFLGVLGRRIDPANFEKFFASVALGKGAAISMFHRDGTLIARHPHVASMIGQKFASAPLIDRSSLSVSISASSSFSSSVPLHCCPAVWRKRSNASGSSISSSAHRGPSDRAARSIGMADESRSKRAAKPSGLRTANR